MAVLKSKTRLVMIISSYVVHPYACFLSILYNNYNKYVSIQA